MSWTNAILMTLLHSLWQSALIYFVYQSVTRLLRFALPESKKRLLYLLLTSQWGLSFLTFFWLSIPTNKGVYSLALVSDYIPQWHSYLVYAYLLVVVLKCGKLIYDWKQWHLPESLLGKAPASFRIFVQQHAQLLNIRKKVRVYVTEHVNNPLTYGFFKPIILLPVSCLTHLSAKEVEMLLLHELKHIQQHDYFINWIRLIFDQVYFFNPCYRLLSKEIETLREQACDYQVMQFKYDAISYADVLVKMASWKMQPVHAVGAVGNKQQLWQRIQMFPLFAQLKPMKWWGYATGWLMVLLIGGFLQFLQPRMKANTFNVNEPSLVFEPVGMKDERTEVIERTPSQIILADASDKVNGGTQLQTEIDSYTTNSITKEINSIELNGSTPELQYENIPSEFHLVSEIKMEPQKVSITEVDPITGEVSIQIYWLMFINNEWIVVPDIFIENTPASKDTIDLPQ